MTRYGLLGMAWDSEVDLHLPESPTLEPVDLRLRYGDVREVGDQVPAGRQLAHMLGPDGRLLYTFVDVPTGYVMRFHRLLDIEVTATLDEAVVHLAPGTDPGFAGVLCAGMLASTVLMLRGHPVLHGSAVESDVGTFALVGASGMGKSTVSALLCQRGARLITDDVLRLDRNADAYLCRLGAVESRLRGSNRLAVADEAARITSDGRYAVTAGEQASDALPLQAIVVPYPRRGLGQVEVDWLAPRAALMELLRFPRIVGWTDEATTAAHFAFVGELVRHVPVGRLNLPWQDTLQPSLADEILAVLGRRPVWH